MIPAGQPLGKIGNTVWRDRNSDGVQQDKERGIAGALITLILADGTTREAITDSDGQYVFDGLVAGNYQVKIAASSKPTNGPVNRAVVLGNDEVNLAQDFGFNDAGVKGVQIVREDGTLAFTGAESMRTLSTAMMLIGFGGLIITRRRELQE